MRLRSVNLVMGASLAIFFAYATGGCPTPAPKPPPFDASDASAFQDADAEGDSSLRSPSCAAACAKMKTLRCPEAEQPDGGKTCYLLCADAEGSGKFSLKSECLARAGTVADLRACGTVRCVLPPGDHL